MTDKLIEKVVFKNFKIKKISPKIANNKKNK